MKPEPQLVEAWHALTAGLRPAIVQGHVIDVLRDFPAEAFQAVVTSPPYWSLRLYGTEPQVWGGRKHDHTWAPTAPRRPRSVNDVKNPESKQVTSRGQDYDAQWGESCECGAWRGELGLEPTPELYVQHIGDVFDAARRVLRSDGVLWLNLGDTYSGGNNGYNPGAPSNANGASLQARSQSGSPADRNVTWATRKGCKSGLPIKNLVGIPWRVAFELQRRGWWLRSDCVWAKPNPMPESVVDRPTRAHEYVFLLTKSARYFYDADAVRRPLAPSTEERARSHYSNPADNPDTASKWGPDEWRAYPVQGRANPPTAANLKTVWWLPTEPVREAHFATFPQDLVDVCLRASTSEKGACAECGVPRRREVRAEGGTIGHSWHPHTNDPVEGNVAGTIPSKAWQSGKYRRTNLGFVAGCECGSTETIACAVLDPFGGSGTVPLVARRLGLRSVAVELKPDYVELARKRAGQIADITEAPL